MLSPQGCRDTQVALLHLVQQLSGCYFACITFCTPLGCQGIKVTEVLMFLSLRSYPS